MKIFDKCLLLSFLFHVIWLITTFFVKRAEIVNLINQIGELLFTIFFLSSVAIVSLLSFLGIKYLK